MKIAKHPPILSSSAASLVGQQPASRRRLVRTGAAAAIAMFLVTDIASAATRTWLGGGVAPFNWSLSPPNFDAALANNDDLVFQGNLGTTNTNDTLLNFNSITFAPNAAAFTLQGLDVFLDAGGITNNSSNLQTLAFTPLGGGFGGLTLVASQTWNAATGDLLIATDVTASFVVPTVLTVTGPRNTTVTGVISEFFAGDASLVKEGTGVLSLLGANTYTGNTTINAGTVLVSGSIASRSTFVNSAGTLAGTGLVGGSVFNSGNVAPGGLTGDTRGTLRIGGNYNQSPNGTLTIEIAGKRPGQYDVLAVQGRANLDGTLRLVQVGKAPRLKVGEQIKFLTATGGVNGEFSKVINPFGPTGTIVQTELVYNANSVALEGKQGSYAAFANKFRLTVNQRAVAGALDKVAFRNKETKLIGYLNERLLERLPADFDRIAPDELASIYTIGMSLANVQTGNLQRRTADLRSGANGFSANGYHAAGSGPSYSGGVGGPTGNEGKESKEVFVPTPDNRWGVFLTGVGEWVDVDGDGNARGYDVTTGGFTLGLDYKVTPNFAIGVNAGYAGTGADLSGDGRVFVNGGKLGVYATYFTGGFYVDTAVTGGYNSYDTKRSALQGTARGDTDGSELNVLFGTGYDFKVGALTVGPTANFQYTYLGLDGFTERGSLAPLTYGDQNEESIRTSFGLKASYDWKLGGVIIKPELRAAWQHEYGSEAFDIQSSLGSGGNFTVRGPEIGRDSLLLGAGFAILWNERTATYVYYDGELARQGYEAHNVSGGVRVAF